MTPAEYALVAIAVVVSSAVQATSGFGFALLGVPLMTLAIPARDAVVVSTLLGMSVSWWQAWHGRAHAIRPLVVRMTAAAYAGMPLGLWAFVAVSDRTLRLWLGVSVLLAVVLLVKRIDLSHTGPGLDIGAGFVSGVLNTSVSTNGPPLVFALQARHLEAAAFRATITMVFALSNLAGLSLFVAAGKVHRSGLVAVAIALPGLFAGQVVGHRLRRHLHGDRFRRMVIWLLVAAAASAIVAALT
jgi:uncharacterized membrane protein YfcA